MANILGSNNDFPSVLITEGTPATPAAGHQRLGIRTSDHNIVTVNSSGTVTAYSPASAAGVTSNFPAQGRLTLTTAVPVTTSDVTAATTLYFTPYKGNQIATYSGSAWTLSTFAEKSITLASLTANLPYDVFIVDSTLALELLAWTNTTTRATAIVLQDGIYCKTGALTRRYLGTICITGTTGQCEDSLLRRFVYNYYNAILRPMRAVDTTDSWNYGTTTWRQANGATANKVEYICGVNESPVVAEVQGSNTSNGSSGAVGIGLDATNANSAQILHDATPLTTSGIARATYRGWPGIGYHYLAWIEYSRVLTSTFLGDGGLVDQQSGITAEVWA